MRPPFASRGTSRVSPSNSTIFISRANSLRSCSDGAPHGWRLALELAGVFEDSPQTAPFSYLAPIRCAHAPTGRHTGGQEVGRLALKFAGVFEVSFSNGTRKTIPCSAAACTPHPVMITRRVIRVPACLWCLIVGPVHLARFAKTLKFWRTILDPLSGCRPKIRGRT